MGTGISPPAKKNMQKGQGLSMEQMTEFSPRMRTRSRLARRTIAATFSKAKDHPCGGWEFRRPRISFALPSVSKLPPLCGEEANPFAPCATDGCGYLFQSKRPPLRWSFALEQMTGIEPAFLAWEANALPLSYICIFNLRQLLYSKARALSMPFLNFIQHYPV